MCEERNGEIEMKILTGFVGGVMATICLQYVFAPSRPLEKTLFHASDQVLVIKGFYEGAKGRVDGIEGINFKIGVWAGGIYHSVTLPPDFLSKESSQ